MAPGKIRLPLPEPINSSDDDFAFVADADMQTGYFSSNRRNNDDIYQFKSLIIRKASCDTLVENTYCYELYEENAIRYRERFTHSGTNGISEMVVQRVLALQ